MYEALNDRGWRPGLRIVMDFNNPMPIISPAARDGRIFEIIFRFYHL